MTTWEREEDERPPTPLERVDAGTSGAFAAVITNGVVFGGAFVGLAVLPDLAPLWAAVLALLGVAQVLWLGPLAAAIVLAGDRPRALGVVAGGALTLTAHCGLLSLVVARYAWAWP